MEKYGRFSFGDNFSGCWTQRSQAPETAPIQHHQQASYKSPPLSHRQQQASPVMLQALSIVSKMMQQQQENFRIMASMSDTAATWNAVYKDHFAEKYAQLQAECQRFLGPHHISTESHSSPVNAVHVSQQSSSDLLEVKRGRRPHPVDQGITVWHHIRNSSQKVRSVPSGKTPSIKAVRIDGSFNGSSRYGKFPTVQSSAGSSRSGKSSSLMDVLSSISVDGSAGNRAINPIKRLGCITCLQMTKRGTCFHIIQLAKQVKTVRYNRHKWSHRVLRFHYGSCQCNNTNDFGNICNTWFTCRKHHQSVRALVVADDNILRTPSQRFQRRIKVAVVWFTPRAEAFRPMIAEMIRSDVFPRLQGQIGYKRALRRYQQSVQHIHQNH